MNSLDAFNRYAMNPLAWAYKISGLGIAGAGFIVHDNAPEQIATGIVGLGTYFLGEVFHYLHDMIDKDEREWEKIQERDARFEAILNSRDRNRNSPLENIC